MVLQMVDSVHQPREEFAFQLDWGVYPIEQLFEIRIKLEIVQSINEKELPNGSSLYSNDIPH